MSVAPLREQRPSSGRHDHRWIAAVLALLAGGVSLLDAGWRPERVVYDSALALWSQPPPPDITIIAVDEASLAAIGRWPWSRAVHATLLEQLQAARPRAVALDFVLSEPDPDPQQDALLAAAMARHGNVVLPLPWVATPGGAPHWLMPPPVLAGAAARLAASEPTVDSDGVLRHVFLQVGAPGALRDHLALAMLKVAGESLHPALRPQRRPLPGANQVADAEHAEPAPPPAAGWLRDQRLLLRYGGPPGHVQRVSYVDVLTGRVPAQALQGRHLLVGMTAAGLGDTLATPVNARQHAMPGVEVLAQTLHMLRSGQGMQAVPSRWHAAASAALAGLAVLALARLGQRAALLAALGAALLLPVASVLAVGAGWWFSPLPLMAALLLAYPLLSWRRLEAAAAGLDVEIRRLQLQQDDGLLPAPGADPIQGRLDRLQSTGELLHAARRFLADVLASLPTGMLVADAAGRVLMANLQAAVVFEVDTADEMRGLDLVRLLGEFDTGTTTDWAALLAALQPGGDSPSVPARMAGQGDFMLQFGAADLAGSRRLLVTLSDVAAIRRAERQREEALAFVSHDLRSPASTIVLLTDAASGPGMPDWRQQVHTLAQRMLSLSEAFVRHAQTELLEPQIGPVALRALLDDVLSELSPQAAAAGIELRTLVDPPTAVFALDRSWMARAIVNLAANGVRHCTAAGTVTVQLQIGDDASLRIFVGDDGPGLSADQHRQLEDGDDGLSSGHQRGVGMGLRFVQRVARHHGGTLHWRPASPPRQGGFWLTVPAAASTP